MAESIKIDNFSSSIVIDNSELAQDIAPSATAVPLLNARSVVTNTFLLIGPQGSESAELCGVASVSGDNVTITSGVSRQHLAHTAVTVLQADKFSVYRAANVDGTVPADAAFTLLGQIGLATDAMQTTYVDQTGGSGYWYKVTQYNSLTATETALADSTAVRGGGAADYATLDDIRAEAGFQYSHLIPDATISMYRRRAQIEIDSKLGTIYVVPFSPVPDEVNQLTVLLAAGWLLKKEYSSITDGTATNKDGSAKLTEARTWIAALVARTAVLTGANLLPEEVDPGGSVSGSTDVCPIFDMDMEF